MAIKNILSIILTNYVFRRFLFFLLIIWIKKFLRSKNFFLFGLFPDFNLKGIFIVLIYVYLLEIKINFSLLI